MRISISRLRILAFFAPFLSSVLLFLYTLKDRSAMSQLMSRGSYYIILALVLLWVVTLVRYLDSIHFSFRQFFLRYYPGLILSLVVTACVYISIKPSFRPGRFSS